MKTKLLPVLIVLLVLSFGSALAQSDEPKIRLHLRRTFGYQGGDKIQGRFSLQISGEDEITSVDYLIDDEIMASLSEPPFEISFSTSSYLPGEHFMQAVATNLEAEQLDSQIIRLTFITAEQSWKSAGRIAAWILVGALIIMFVGIFGAGWLSKERGRFEPGVYSAAGGAVCKRCKLPFSRHFLSPNLLLGKLERCPHCGRIAIVPRANRASLEVAEERYREDRVKGQREVRWEEDELKQRLDDTRYEG
jgi:rRNA maturation protein Nop10